MIEPVTIGLIVAGMVVGGTLLAFAINSYFNSRNLKIACKNQILALNSFNSTILQLQTSMLAAQAVLAASPQGASIDIDLLTKKTQEVSNKSNQLEAALKKIDTVDASQRGELSEEIKKLSQEFEAANKDLSNMLENKKNSDLSSDPRFAFIKQLAEITNRAMDSATLIQQQSSELIERMAKGTRKSQQKSFNKVIDTIKETGEKFSPGRRISQFFWKKQNASSTVVAEEKNRRNTMEMQQVINSEQKQSHGYNFKS